MEDETGCRRAGGTRMAGMMRQQVTNTDIAAMLTEIADILTLRGVAFKPRAYLRAARAIESLDEEITDIYDRGELETIPGVGSAIAAKITTIMEEGTLPYLDQLREEVPPGLRDLMEIEGIGPKKAHLLYTERGITGIEDLEAAVNGKQVRTIRGFGEQSEKKIAESIRVWKERHTRFLLGYILHDAEAIGKKLQSHPAVMEACLAGSIRRRKETIGDVDILVSTDDPDTVSAFFCSLPERRRVLMQGPKRSTIVLAENLHVDLRVIRQGQFGAALQYFTGSKAHNIRLRQRAIDRGWKLNEYGLTTRDGAEVIAREREEDIYDALGLAFIPPELRENSGEIEAAAEERLPRLIGYGEVKGDLHVHTRWSDGAHTIREMAEAARERGCEYIAICDHSEGLPVAHGISADAIFKQGKEIADLNREPDGITVLHGIEANIDRDGSLDVRKKVLRDLDFVIGSIHSSFRQPEAEMTERLLTAIHHDHLDMIGHPTGRLIMKRDPYRFDMDTVFEAAAAAHVLMEINAFPTRLDLSDVNCRRAHASGVMMGIGTDAHHMDHLRYLELGIAVARRGWLEKGDVINTRPLAEFSAWLEK
ncbi:DNA polymerase/3'-5' exonuclease PolX [Methanogenium sp. S4BF]|uniref:DNA polymerase/3'-5' exonuclease PolX n=1 Tax=Methanogenium sp. S4BF TaxID=1789226 RepID=UPI00241611E4|nr:DNA polymerase/3'-5' exonuclease PolX [Methanogenium sp. S4BF]WFN35639.1 DNA polymerase/3'-5' exonuclease PolX [Methanogenium sp. S4BF]